MGLPRLKIVIFGLSITSSWGNGHATTYRSIVRELSSRGHEVLFLERDAPWYAGNRDMARPPYGRTELYSGLSDLKERFEAEVREADVVIVGSYVPEGSRIGEWLFSGSRGVTAFYDIDTPVTIANLERGGADYITERLIPRYDMYLSFTGGPLLGDIERRWGSPKARPLYCSVDPELYRPIADSGMRWELGYIGTYSADRQGPLERLMLEPARVMSGRRFVVAGPLYPERLSWPANVDRIEHVPPRSHARFYNSMRFTMNITRVEMARAGHSPSVRLFEAAACATPIISDWWEGLDSFFEPGEEILISARPEDTVLYLMELPERERMRIGARARSRVLASHTAAHRADELEGYMMEALKRQEVPK